MMIEDRWRCASRRAALPPSGSKRPARCRKRRSFQGGPRRMVIQLPMLHPKGRVPFTRQPRTDARPPAASGAATNSTTVDKTQPACFQAIPRARDAPAGTGQHHRRHRQSNRLAAALSSWILRRRGAQEARPHARVREDRHRAGLPHRGQKSRTQGQGAPQGGMTRSP